MKKFFVVLLAFCMLGTTAYGADQGMPDAEKTAIPSRQVVIWDGQETTMQCYSIGGYKYFRLRDVAEAVTNCFADEYYHFDIEYNHEFKCIDIKRETDYVPVEGAAEYTVGEEDKQAVPTDVRTAEYAEGYVIDGYTFYRIRDIANEIRLDVNWCEKERVIEVTGRPRFNEDGTPIAYRKPILYLYPEETMDISVKVDCDLTATYPTYNDGWRVTARPDGTLTNHADGKEYSYLFWEGEGYGKMDFSEGFCVKGEDTAAFLQETLAAMGLTPKEYNEFIVYWLPYMQENAYNLISFQWENYDEAAKLEITPAPDNMLRVFMAFQALDAPVEIPGQKLPTLQREGFTVVEWGGMEVK